MGAVTVIHAQRSPRGSGEREIPDSLTAGDSTGLHTTAYRLTPLLGDPYIAPMDTNRFNFANSTFVEGHSLSVGYLANIGSPALTRLFQERKEARDFIFADPYDYYITTPENACFYDTKIPYTNLLYSFNGGDQKKEERFKGVLSVSSGKRINAGGEMDYIYSHGHYRSNGNKLLSYRLFGNYLSDHYEVRAYLSNFNFINAENGGLTNDEYITNPDKFTDGRRNIDSKAYPVRYFNVFNRVRGKQYFLTHRYNLGFYRTPEATGEEGGDPVEKFVPVSSIIHTLVYEDNRRHFTSSDMAGIDTCYREMYEPVDSALHDRPSSWSIRNTVALSLREGFQDWVKFGLTAFLHIEKRQFKLSALNSGGREVYNEFSTYIGAELSKRLGSVLTYNGRGELCVVGDDLGEFRFTGNLQTRFFLSGKEATILAEGYIKNVTPAFFLRHNHSRYFVWDNSLKNEQQAYAGAVIDLESTRTRLSAGVNSIQNYVFIDGTGHPAQYGSNLQVLTGRLKQDLRTGSFGWENEAAFQVSSNGDVLPLPRLSLYSNLYVNFKIAKVLFLQLGADVHYFAAYDAPVYEPATQLFQLQDENKERVKVGDYPIINAYANFHLKQARFFVSACNVGSKLIRTDYFAFPHYPLNPYVLKFGISVTFKD
jgi:hypothetical protein